MCRRRQTEKKVFYSSYLPHKNMFLKQSENLDIFATRLFSNPDANSKFPIKMAH